MLRALAWVSLAVQVGIVGTGGAVRLTGSGLGCPTWPRCTPDSFVVQPELGIHGAIEFGNRLLTFVLVLVTVGTLAYVARLRRERKDLFHLAIALAAGIPAQAVLGGITVLTGLDPWLVGAHFVLSGVLVSIAAVFVFRTYTPPGGAPPVPARARLAYATALVVTVAVVLGVITTGAGPHAGDAATPRNGLSPGTLQLVHSAVAYLAFGLTALLVISTTLPRTRLGTWAQLLLAVEVGQIAVGIAQSRLQLPPWLVVLHMVLACFVIAAVTVVVLALREPAPQPARSAV